MHTLAESNLVKVWNDLNIQIKTFVYARLSLKYLMAKGVAGNNIETYKTHIIYRQQYFKQKKLTCCTKVYRTETRQNKQTYQLDLHLTLSMYFGWMFCLTWNKTLRIFFSSLAT